MLKRCQAGRVVDCDADREPELFWALRGAGGGQFGVVTSLMFATVAEPRATRFELHWPEAAAVHVVAGWQDWASEAPDDVTASLSLVAGPGHPLRVAVFGAALRDAEPAIAVLESLAVRTGVRPEIRYHVLTWRDLKRSFAGPQSHGAVLTVGRSEFFSHPMPASAVVPLIDELTSGAPPGRRELSFTASTDGLGGQVARRGRTGLRLARQGRMMPRNSDDAADASRPACSSAWRISAGLFARSTW